MNLILQLSQEPRFEQLMQPDSVAEVFSNGVGSETLFFFIHIPKTAGTSFGEEMDRILHPSVNLSLDYTNSESNLHEQRRKIISQTDFNKLRFARGHIPYSFAKGIKHRNISFLTFLRNPVSRILSDHAYQISETHPLRDEARARWPDLAAFVRNDGMHNKMYKFLCKDRCEPVEAVIKRMEKEFLFVGIVEKYEICFRAITTILGNQRHPELVQNVTSKTKRHTDKISPELISEIRSLNTIDYAIYDHFKAMWDVREPEILEVLNYSEKPDPFRNIKKFFGF